MGGLLRHPRRHHKYGEIPATGRIPAVWKATVVLQQPPRYHKYGKHLCNRKNLGNAAGNSLSLSGVCDDRGQLPREGAMY